MIVAIVVSGIVQALTFWATLKYLGIALGTLALMPGIFINGIVAIFMFVPLAGVFAIGVVRSFGAALAGSAAMGYLIRRRQRRGAIVNAAVTRVILAFE